MTTALVIVGALACAMLVASGFLVKLLVDERARAEHAWAQERAQLVQRIQAPREAVWEHTQQTVPVHAPPAVTPDDDEDFWESREALADRLAAEEAHLNDA